jgi:eukaryotic-like serine/threonine-protein kinase
MLMDSENLRLILGSHYPGLTITDVALKSGQRIVYFGEFLDFERPEAEDTIRYDWSKWGRVAIKISDGTSASDVARMQNEISALIEIDSPYYPKLYHYELLSFNPITEEPLKPKLFVTIEEYIASVPLSSCMEKFDSEQKVVHLLINLLTGLKVLWEHPRKYVHRDIKPANILVKDSREPLKNS